MITPFYRASKFRRVALSALPWKCVQSKSFPCKIDNPCHTKRKPPSPFLSPSSKQKLYTFSTKPTLNSEFCSWGVRQQFLKLVAGDRDYPIPSRKQVM